MAGSANAYSASVLMALEQLREKGVPVKDMPINVMGHSQGGIIAARLADRMRPPDSSVGSNHETREVSVPMSRELAARANPEVQAALDPLGVFYPGGESHT